MRLTGFFSSHASARERTFSWFELDLASMHGHFTTVIRVRTNITMVQWHAAVRICVCDIVNVGVTADK